MVHGQTTGAETGRSSGGIRVYVCVYAVNAMNHLDSFKSDVVNPTPSPSLSLVLILVRFSSLCSFGLSSGHGWSAVWSDRGTYGHRHFHRIREISGDRIERREGRRGERGGRSWSDRDESIRIEAWVYALLQRIALITDREGLVSRRKIASVSQSLRH